MALAVALLLFLSQPNVLLSTLLRQPYLVLTFTKLMATLFTGALDAVWATHAMFKIGTGKLCCRQRVAAGVTLLVLTLLQLGIHRDSLVKNETLTVPA